MNLPDWPNLPLADGVMREPTADADRLVAWVPSREEAGRKVWLRVGNVPRAEVVSYGDMRGTAASVTHASVPSRGFLGGLFGKSKGAAGDRSWTLPSGEHVEAIGERENDVLLVWSETSIDEAAIRKQWPSCHDVREVAMSVFVVGGVAPKRAPAPPAKPPEGSARDQAQWLLDASRKNADRAGELSALIDLGVLQARAFEFEVGIATLDGALSLAEELSDRPREVDALVNLGTALGDSGNPDGGRELLLRAQTLAQEIRDRPAEAKALEGLARIETSLHQYDRALALTNDAIAIAKDLNNRVLQAELFWSSGVLYAAMGHRDWAMISLQNTVTLLNRLGDPRASWYADHMKKFQAGAAAPSRPDAGTDEDPASPGFLQMAANAANSLSKFLGSGMKVSSPEVAKERIAVCNTCEYHTGLRCRVCGCFTAAKVRMQPEVCPLGKWPS